MIVCNYSDNLYREPKDRSCWSYMRDHKAQRKYGARHLHIGKFRKTHVKPRSWKREKDAHF